MVVIYGIKNCDTMKKARAWLDGRSIAYAFHDYKIAGLDARTLQEWIEEVGWEPLLNRQGTTFRKLPEAQRLDAFGYKAVYNEALMQMVDGRTARIARGELAVLSIRRGRGDLAVKAVRRPALLGITSRHAVC